MTSSGTDPQTAPDPIVVYDDSDAQITSASRTAGPSLPLPPKPGAPPRTEQGRPEKRPRKPKPPPEPVRLNQLHAPWLDKIPNSSRTSSERYVNRLWYHGCQSNIADRMLHEEMAAYQKYLASTPAERTMRDAVTQRLATSIKSRLRDARVYTYGSSATGLSLPNGCVVCAVHIHKPDADPFSQGYRHGLSVRLCQR